MPKVQIQVSLADIAEACRASGALWRKVDPNQLARARGIKTPLRGRQALLAVARNALAALLIEQFKLGNIQQLTRAIRAGHAGDATDFDAINLAAAQSLGLLEN